MKKYKRATISISKITPSNFTIKLRKDNKRLIKRLERLEQLENVPFIVRRWFGKDM
ncbi:hypothetical protein [Bacillus norwichensis]|uniref:Uncharacterized protein n=1 Tax=Bacillus norwichensis TaxID=2762217 RepID=A0ABR8VSC6_9BACI|nr:hypothetical protein [Bacillus norwichensis]MBD8007688.1 hypothetical protein [Bacillus norwichensis]